MNVLIVQNKPFLGELWQRHLQRHAHTAEIATDQESAIAKLSETYFPIIILDVVLDEGSAFAVADYASYRHPDARVIFVTNTSFFSDGSIFQLCSNACAFVPSATQPEDLAAMVEHYAKTS
ncbi:response regulator [Marivita hallyeonensis]|uniref:Response regulator receiver domain-containing protein n=1 Tax=Marivita hallyeonensis TaxID=996342 RepID=A0A1M5XCG8_9RHOB|nr:response regulator [Marivita hallyeonensis]SHH97511.1 Response regulator receiver domain-containing protein [Marivita hallyeonensis]